MTATLDAADEALAQQIRRAAEALETLVNSAIGAGLKVGVDVQRFHTAGDPQTRRVQVGTSVSRPTR